jgi:hypothetical protein
MDCKPRKYAVKVVLEACDDGDLKTAKAVQKQFQLDVDDLAVGLEGRFALIRACRNGRLKVAQWLTKTFNLTWEDAYDNNHMALIDACKARHFEVVIWLIDTFYD